MSSENEATLLLRIKQVGGDILDGVKDKLSEIKDVVMVVAGAIAAFAAAAIHEFKQAEQSSNALNQAMVQQGIYTKALREEYSKMSNALAEKSVYQDDEITQAQAVIQGMIGQKKISQELMQATLNLAAAKKMDLKSAAEIVGKTIGSETNALARQGIELENVRDKSARTAEVIEKLNSRFGGQAEAATKGLGAMDMLKKSGMEFLQAVGERLAPVVIAITTELMNFATEIRNSKGAMDGIMSVMEAVVQIGVVLKGIFEVTGKVIGNVLAGIAGGMTELINGNFKAAWDNAKAIVEVSGSDIADVWEKSKAELKKIDDAFYQSQVENAAREEELVAASEDRKLEIIKEKAALRKEFFITKNQDELMEDALFQQTKEDQAAMRRLKELNAIIAHSNNKLAVAKAETEKERIMRDQKAKLDIERETGVYQVQAFLNSERVKNTNQMLGTISTLQNSHSKELVAIGKAAAIAQAIINTAQGVTLALATFPGPFGIALGALVAAAGAVQIGTIAGVAMADGGIVKATPGGVPAIIGEGGRDEAVIPLENGQIPGSGGGGLTINFNGSFLGDENQAMEVAKVLDRAFLRLKQSNQSVAFDSEF